MKKESRILYVSCHGELCCLVVARGDKLLDWVWCGSRRHMDEVFCSASVRHETSCYVTCGSARPPQCIKRVCNGSLCGFVGDLVEELYRLLGDLGSGQPDEREAQRD